MIDLTHITKFYQFSQRQPQRSSQLSDPLYGISRKVALRASGIKEGSSFEPLLLLALLANNSTPHAWHQRQMISSSGRGRKEKVFKTSNSFLYTLNSPARLNLYYFNLASILNCINRYASNKALLCTINNTKHKLLITNIVNLLTNARIRPRYSLKFTLITE